MQQTFVFSYGKLVLENGILYIRKTKPALTVSQTLNAFLPVIFAARFVFYLLEDPSPKRNVGVILFGCLVVLHVLLNSGELYKFLFKRSFRKRIPLHKIKATRTEDDPNELEVHLYLQLQSGRERKITFRKLENQHEAFVLALSEYLSVPKTA
jgi:hypothetical protein